MSDARRGLPLLSEPPPTLSPDSDIACRRCNKEFHLIFVRSRKCNHCGYLYCYSCSDFQALMPRSGSDTGYDPMHVCGFCIEFLNITAAGRNTLKSLPLAKLKKYVTSYDIKINRAVEKDDIIDGILAARRPNGCLPPANENFYRKHSVPSKGASGRSRGLFSRSGQGSSSAPPRPPPRPATRPTYEFPRPDLEPDHQPPPRPHTFRPPPGPPPSQPPRPQQQQHNSPPRPPPSRPNVHTPPHHQHQHQHPPPPPGRPHANGGSGGYQPNYGGHVPPTPSYMTRPQPPPQQSPPQSNYHSHSSPPRAAPYNSAPPPPTPRPRAASVAPPPNLDQLLEMTADAIGSLSISALKSILFTNHVTTTQILEKGDLVKKVLVLIADEKAERVRQRQMEEREEMERLQRAMEGMDGPAHPERDMEEAGERDREANDPGPRSDIHHNDSEKRENEGGHETNHSRDSSTSAPQPKPTASPFERPGMCVICQDEDANIAIIDCGHMAMCRACSELVMASSKECPLCRTRIVTEARLLRIFRT
ncbi:hypothetical protein BYT27DRAFT_7081707 [Phlegmacium glaucopus]|nr:hypothetical protein BYT27DRAFT_7081707 [Phlegmacium glaucopus]